MSTVSLQFTKGVLIRTFNEVARRASLQTSGIVRIRSPRVRLVACMSATTAVPLWRILRRIRKQPAVLVQCKNVTATTDEMCVRQQSQVPESLAESYPKCRTKLPLR